jgi:hypothetical protein
MSLKLLAFDAEDLAVISAHLQDATVAAGDAAWLPAERRFALVCRRVDHVGGGPAKAAGVHFDHVLKVERLRPPPADQPMLVVGLGFEAGEAPSGRITLLFDRGAAIRLTVECIEGVLQDLPDDTGG